MPPDARFSHEVLETPEAVLSEQHCWNRLVSEWYHSNPFLTMEHHQAWLSEVAGRDVGVRFIKVSTGGKPIAYFPLLEHRTFHRVRARCLGFPGVGLTGPILDGQYRDAALDYFCASVLPSLEWDVFGWERATPESLSVDGVLGAFRKAGYLVAHRPDEGNWIYEGAATDFQTYLSSLGASTRREVRRIAKRLCSREGGFELRMFRNEECLDALRDYDLVRSVSWKSGERYPRYIREMLRQLGALGLTRMGVVALGGRPVATLLWLCSKGRAYTHTSAYDASFQAYSPGTFLLAQAMRSAIEDDRVLRVDFLRGDEPYKQHWANRRQVLHNFVFFPATARGRALRTFDHRVVPFVRSSKLLTSVATFAFSGAARG